MGVFRKILLLSIAFMVIVGCEQELCLDESSDRNTLSFNTAVEAIGNTPMTRSVGDYLMLEMSDWKEGLPIGELNTKGQISSNLTGSAGIFGYSYDDTFDANGRVITNAKYVFDGDALLPETPFAWANFKKGKAFFASYAPYASFGDTYMTPMVYNDYPAVSYTVPDDIDDQKDVLYASYEMNSSDFRQSVPLTYRHALTAIQFRMGFACTVKYVKIKNVKSQGVFTFHNGWESSTLSGESTYTLSFNGGLVINEELGRIGNEDDTFILLPQTFETGSSAAVELSYVDNTGEHVISASLAGSSWVSGKKIVYTLYKESVKADYVYLDFGIGPISITDTGYSGRITVGGNVRDVVVTDMTKEQMEATKFYIYMSVNSGDAAKPNTKPNTGYASEADMAYPERCRIPQYEPMSWDGIPWGDYITNNRDVVSIINNWETKREELNRPRTEGTYIKVDGTCKFDVTIDNLTTKNTIGPVYFEANQAGQLTLRLKGDSRFDNVIYRGAKQDVTKFIITSVDGNGAKSGTLTVASTDPTKMNYDIRSIIGPSTGQESYGLTFNGGTIFGGYPPQNNWVWGIRGEIKFPLGIGGGNNKTGEVTINGGRLTAVANGTSPAIGGGGGYDGVAGNGIVTITGGEVYAYAKGIYSTDDANNRRGYVATAAIGGSSTFNTDVVGQSIITITGGYVYAESMGGTAIGGGNSMKGNGGEAEVNISGDAIVIAKSTSGTAYNGTIPVSASTAIGGGSSVKKNGGSATINITGGHLSTGSIGGGGADNPSMKIGSASISISGNPEIAGQFVMAKGANVAPSFNMTGGTIYSTTSNDETFERVQLDGGAVYMEEGTCVITGGTIRNRNARNGGAIYMTGGSFRMEGGTIMKNGATANGGGVYISGGNVEVSGGSISENVASDGNGGGVFVSGGSFQMKKNGTGTITKNSANSRGSSDSGNGGGIYVVSDKDVTTDLISGNVTYNTADRNGGGVFVDAGTGSNLLNITIGYSGGTPSSPIINNNSASLSGGGLCVLGTNTTVDIYSGTIHGYVSQNVKNPDIRNDGGIVTLYGTSANMDIMFNVVTFNANNGTNATAQQRIVTSSQSYLAPPSSALGWKKEFYTLTGWNTKADGSGQSYNLHGGEIMNISEDIELFAVWTSTADL